MTCCNSCNTAPCCCPDVNITTTTTTTTTCPGGEPCSEAILTDCVIYNSSDLECYGVTPGMTITEVIGILLNLLPDCTTTTTTTVAP